MKRNKKRPHTEALMRYLRRDYILEALLWGSCLELACVILCLWSQERSALSKVGFFPMISALIIGVCIGNGAANRLRLEMWRKETASPERSFEEEKFTAIGDGIGLYVSDHWLQYINRRNLQLYFLQDIESVQALGSKRLTVSLRNENQSAILYVPHGGAQVVAGELCRLLQGGKASEGTVCSACGAVNDRRARYCGNCGAPLAEGRD